jgi:hypothetical protein
MGSELRKMTKSGGECRCHISPHCDWCGAMTEAEVDAWADGGMPGLRALWDAEDEAAERDAALAELDALRAECSGLTVELGLVAAERDSLRAEVAQLHADRAVLVTVMVTSAPPDLLQEVLPADPGEVLSVVRALTLMVIESPDHRGIIAYVRALMARMEAEQISALGGGQ